MPRIEIKSRIENKVKYFFAKNIQGETFGFFLEEPHIGEMCFTKNLESIDWKFSSIELLEEVLERYKVTISPRPEIIKTIRLDRIIKIVKRYWSNEENTPYYVVVDDSGTFLSVQGSYGADFDSTCQQPYQMQFESLESVYNAIEQYKKKIYQNERIIKTIII
jgi:hypothetical protein